MNNPNECMLPEIPKPSISKVDWFPLGGMVVVFLMAVKCVFEDNWLGAFVDLGIIALLGIYCIWRYRAGKRLWHQYETLSCVRQILLTPVMREEGHSLIFTFIAPSQRLMESVRPMISNNAKDMKGEKR